MGWVTSTLSSMVYVVVLCISHQLEVIGDEDIGLGFGL